MIDKKIIITITFVFLLSITSISPIKANFDKFEGQYWSVVTNDPTNDFFTEKIFGDIKYFNLKNHDSVVVFFAKEFVEEIKYIQLSGYSSDYSYMYGAKTFESARYYPGSKYAFYDYITGVQLSANVSYNVTLYLDDYQSLGLSSSRVTFNIVIKNLNNPTNYSVQPEYYNFTNETDETLKAPSTNDISNYNPNTAIVTDDGEVIEGDNTGETEKAPTYSQVEELKALIEQLKKELENANNKLQQLENVLNELKPIASNIEQSVSSINDKLDTTNNKLTDINNQLTPSNNKPIQEFNKNVNDLYSNDFVNQPVIENNEIYYQEKELIDLEVPNIPVMDIEEWEGFSIEEEIEKDEIKTKDEIIEMDNFSLDQILPQQNFELDKPLQMPQMELDKPLEIQEFDIQEFQFDTFEKTNQMERDKPLIWGEKP